MVACTFPMTSSFLAWGGCPSARAIICPNVQTEQQQGLLVAQQPPPPSTAAAELGGRTTLHAKKT